ncbi:MAG: hypothetical protein NUV65_01120 [Candidatus Roizmanbacteria bacterium]|nr:hypothetical protein [Candidatus Roizmanbacteria bacterium]
MKVKLTKGKTVLTVGKFGFDTQDILILCMLVVSIIIFASIIEALGFSGSAAFSSGFILCAIIYRNILKAKGHIK